MRRSPKRWHQPLDDADAARLDADRARALAQLRARFPALEAPRRELVARRLEHMLFHAAHSRAEFARSCTLARRVQALVTLDLESSSTTSTSTSEAPAAAPVTSRREAEDASPTTHNPKDEGQCGAPDASCRMKRPRRASVVGIECAAERRAAAASCKRRRRGSFHASTAARVTINTLPAELTPSTTTPPSSTAVRVHGAPQTAAGATMMVVATAAREQLDELNMSSTVFLDNDADLLAQVFGFLDGHELLRARAVNQFLAAHAPSMVHSLTLDARKLSINGALGTPASATLAALLLKCTSLRRLVVTNSRNAASRNFLSDLPRGYSLPVSSSATSSSSPQICYGSQVLAQVTAAFRQNACLSLEALELHAPFEFATESDTILECLDALVYRYAHHPPFAGGAQQQRPAVLRRLMLDSTFLGDARVQQLAARLQCASSASYFRELETLHLRGNFVGEAGCEALFQHLRQCPRLRELDMSGNILTDTDAVVLAAALKRDPGASSKCVQSHALLHRIALHENYIGLDGFCALSSAICTRLLNMSDEEMDARGDERSLVEVSCAKNCAPVRKVARLFQF